jgi:hypothetical protein
VSALRKKNSALGCLLQDEMSRESAITLGANAAATTVFLEQFTATMGALREINRALVRLLQDETSRESAVEPRATAVARHSSLPTRSAHSHYGCPAVREKPCFGLLAAR